MFRYSPQQIEFLKVGYLSMNIRELTKAFNKKFRLEHLDGRIKSVLHRKGFKCGRKPKDRLINRDQLFTKEQTDFIAKKYKNKTANQLSKLLKIRFNKEVTAEQIKTFVFNHGIKSGRTGHFEKDHKSWNKGTKGICKPNSGSFKKGDIPGNTKPLGSERICSKDGFVLIKIAEKNPYTGAETRYKHKHVYNWEQENGPVPTGHVVAFKDSDKTNCEPENLILISKAELLRLNQYRYKDIPEDLKPSVLGMIKLQVKTWAMEKT